MPYGRLTLELQNLYMLELLEEIRCTRNRTCLKKFVGNVIVHSHGEKNGLIVGIRFNIAVKDADIIKK
jgi:hypothetical protein